MECLESRRDLKDYFNATAARRQPAPDNALLYRPADTLERGRIPLPAFVDPARRAAIRLFLRHDSRTHPTGFHQPLSHAGPGLRPAVYQHFPPRRLAATTRQRVIPVGVWRQYRR